MSKPRTRCTAKQRLCRGERTCAELGDAGCFCTRAPGHTGPHVACGVGEHNRAVWPQEKAKKPREKKAEPDAGGTVFIPPSPGSDAARKLGCICPVLDNDYGRGAGPWWINGKCPLHGDAARAGKPEPVAGFTVADTGARAPGTANKSAALEAHELIHGARHGDYGPVREDYARTCALFEMLSGVKLTPEAGVCFMVCVKLSREGHKHKHDNIVDAIGYLDLLDQMEEGGA